MVITGRQPENAPAKEAAASFPVIPSLAPAPYDAPIVPNPVLEIAPTRLPPQKLVTCSRCHGQCAPGTRFCKYCGASLDEGPGRPDAASDAQSPPMNVAAFEAAPAPISSPAPHRAPVANPITLKPPPVADAPRPLPPPVRAGSTAPGRVDPTRGPSLNGVPRELGRLVLIAEDGSEGRSYPLMSPQIDIGRSDGEIILRDDPYVSPRHARLAETKDGLVLRDLASTNGVFLRIRKREPLRDGDLLLLGLEVLQFHVVSNAERGLGHATQHGTLLFGSPAVPRHARLCQRTIEGVTRDVYHLFRDETVIGREQGDIVFSADPFLSRRHAAITRDASSGEFSVRDLDSSNGSYRAVREDVAISSGDFVRIGQHLFRVDLR